MLKVDALEKVDQEVENEDRMGNFLVLCEDLLHIAKGLIPLIFWSPPI